MKHETANDIAYRCYQENQPIDWCWIRKIRRERNDKEMIEWARGCVEPFVYQNYSKNKITRAAKILIEYLHL